MLEKDALSEPLTLVLGEKVGAPLNLPAEQVGTNANASPTWIAVALFTLIGLAASALLIPLSQGRWQSPWSNELRMILPESPVSSAVDRMGVQETKEALDSIPEASPAEVGRLIAKLKGKYCFNYMPYGDDADASAAFTKLFWSKLDESLSKVTDGRLEVCNPFAFQTSEVLVGGGCAKSSCGTNDVTFYINRQGKIAMDYRIEGECQYAAEDGFTQVVLLCSN